MQNSQISQYILSQIKSGLAPEDITAQLRGAGWQEADIVAGFEQAQAQIAPPPVQAPAVDTPTQPTPQQFADQPAMSTQPNEPVATDVNSPASQPARQQLPPPIKRGRMKTGWLLFKQSLAIIKTNPALWRYMVMSMLVTFLFIILIIAITVIDMFTTNLIAVPGADDTYDVTLLGYALGVLATITMTSVTFYYATALSSHVLSIFRGEQTQYAQHIKAARSKLPAIITFAIITVIIGYILRTLEQRFRLVGWIISKIIGILWALATTFVISIIADSEASAPTSIKQSIALFKENWAETITSRVTLGGALFLVYFLVMIPVTFVLFMVFGALFGSVGLFIAAAIFIVGVVVLSILETLATNILNVCLYYYAKYGIIPPSFSPELLASVFVDKKKKK